MQYLIVYGHSSEVVFVENFQNGLGPIVEFEGQTSVDHQAGIKASKEINFLLFPNFLFNFRLPGFDLNFVGRSPWNSLHAAKVGADLNRIPENIGHPLLLGVKDDVFIEPLGHLFGHEVQILRAHFLTRVV